MAPTTVGRTRRGRATLAVSSDDSLSSIRLRLLEQLRIHPADCRLFWRGEELEDAGGGLGALGVFPGGEVHVVDAGLHDPDDLTGLFLEDASEDDRRRALEGKGPGREAGVGFANTALGRET